MSTPDRSTTPGSDAETLEMLTRLDRIDLARVVVAGDYVRFDEAARQALKDFRGKVLSALSGVGRRPTNVLIWGAPGSGKSYLVQQVARAAGGSTALVELNLAALDAEGLRAGLTRAGSGSSDVVCLVDEVDAHPTESWPYELLLPALEPATPYDHRIVFCLAGSGGADLAEFRARISARPKGPDLLSRIPVGNEVSVPPLGVGDKVSVVSAQILDAAASEGRSVEEIEKFALFFLATSPALRSARQLRAAAVEGARRLPPGEDRFRFDHLFAPGDPENKRFWYDHEVARSALAGKFVPIEAPTPKPTPSPPAAAPPPNAPESVRLDNPRQRLAILPFLNISPSPADGYFADGLTEELIATVSRIGGLRVIARTSVMRFRDATKSAADTARELKVGSLLEGSVRRAGDDLRVTAQLIDVATEEPVWSMSFDRRIENVFAIQEELARRIAESLHVELVGGEQATLGRIPTRSLQAYDCYLQGRQRFFEVTAAGFTAAIALFERAVALDPQFALAYCGLAEAHALEGNRGFVPLRPALERAERSVRTALRLDPELAEAHAALAPILFNRYDWEGALTELDRALALEPNNVQAHFWRAVSTGTVGRPEDGLPNALRAVELDPLNPRRRIILAQQYYWLRQFENALTVLDSPLLRGTSDAAPMRAYALLELGRAREALDSIETGDLEPTSGDVQVEIDRAAIFARAGKSAEARGILATLLARRTSGDVPAGALAWIYAALGEWKAAAEWYGRAHEEGSMIGVPDLAGDPFLEPFSASPLYEPLVRLFGLHRYGPRPS